MDAPTRKIVGKQRCREITGLSYRAQQRRRERGLEPISWLAGGRVVYFEDDLHAYVERQYQEGVRRVETKEQVKKERVEEWVRRNLENAPPLTVEQRDLLRRLLGGEHVESA